MTLLPGNAMSTPSPGESGAGIGLLEVSDAVLHVCPACGRLFTSPSVCAAPPSADSPAQTVPMRFVARTAVERRMMNLPAEFPDLSHPAEAYVRLADVLGAIS